MVDRSHSLETQDGPCKKPQGAHDRLSRAEGRIGDLRDPWDSHPQGGGARGRGRRKSSLRGSSDATKKAGSHATEAQEGKRKGQNTS